jgi:hypothetical protein
MRIIIKPLGMVAIAVVLAGAFAAVSLRKPGGVASRYSASTSGNLISQDRLKFYTEKSAVGAMTVFQGNVGGATRSGVKVSADQIGGQPWNLGVSSPLGVAFKAGERLKLQFWGRSESSSPVTIILQRNIPGFPDCFKQTVTLTPEWRAFDYEITTATMAKWESMIAVHAGYRVGSVELAGIELVRE